MAKELQAADLDVTYQFSGRPQDKFFDMEVFNGHQWRHGLTFVTEKGKINHLKTVWHSKPLRFLDDINQLDLSSYDLVICDYEPVTAWAARRQNKKTVGISHQYAFQYNIPRAGNDLISETIMQNYAPVNTNIGLHWHHFDQPLLPPVIETPYVSQQNQKNKIIVYLPFEDQRYVMSTLALFKSFDFIMYSPEVIPSMHSHIYCNPLSLQGFQRDLSDCAGIICNAGFELASESLQLGKKILVKPLHAQMEQVSNALALHTLGYGQMMHTIDATIIEQWLHETRAIRVTFPNTARYLVQWIQDGMPQIEQSWCDRIWSEVRVIPVEIS